MWSTCWSVPRLTQAPHELPFLYIRPERIMAQHADCWVAEKFARISLLLCDFIIVVVALLYMRSLMHNIWKLYELYEMAKARVRLSFRERGMRFSLTVIQSFYTHMVWRRVAMAQWLADTQSRSVQKSTPRTTHAGDRCVYKILQMQGKIRFCPPDIIGIWEFRTCFLIRCGLPLNTWSNLHY